MKMSPVIHFEMPAKDKKRMADFYSSVFGWKTQVLGKDVEEYVMVQTAETEENGLPKERGSINGGFYQRKEERGFNVPSVVISVENLEEAMAAVKQAGGQIVYGPGDIPGVGMFASIVDTEDNVVGMLQPSEDMG